MTVANGENFAYACSEILQQVSRRRKSINLVAIGANCIHPSVVGQLLKCAKCALAENEKPFVVYPNSGS